MQDITERVRIIEELSVSEARLQESERMVGVGSWEMPLETRVIAYSDGYARLLGLSPGELLDAERFLTLVHHDDRQIVAKAIRARQRCHVHAAQSLAGKPRRRAQTDSGSASENRQRVRARPHRERDRRTPRTRDRRHGPGNSIRRRSPRGSRTRPRSCASATSESISASGTCLDARAAGGLSAGQMIRPRTQIRSAV
jgi:PAS domain-containing protein